MTSVGRVGAETMVVDGSHAEAYIIVGTRASVSDGHKGTGVYGGGSGSDFSGGSEILGDQGGDFG